MVLQRSRSAAALVMGALSLVALGGGTVVAQEEAPTGTLSVAYESNIDSIDPAIAYDFVSIPAARLIFETLITYGEGTDLVPRLAEAMPTISEDGLTYTFTLRDGVQFVRKGEVVREVTADDVVASINRVLRPDLLPHASPVGGAFFGLIEGADAVLDGTAEAATGIKAIDERTVEFTLTAPDRTFINALAMSFGSVMPAEAALDGAATLADPVGTGPFWMESYTPGELAVFRANPHYWGETGPLVDTIEFHLSVPAETAARQAQAGEVDLTGDNLPAPVYLEVKDDPTYADRIRSKAGLSLQYLAIDTSPPEGPLADARVRQAIAHAVDKENIVRLAGGRGAIAGCLFPGELPGHDASCDPYPYDPDAARALLADAGVEGFSTQVYTDATEMSTQWAESIAADLGAIGIETEVIAQDWDTLLGTISVPHAAPLVVIGWFADFPDPSNFIDPILSCASAVEGGANVSWFCDEAIDAASAAARTDPDLEAIIPTYQDLQGQIMAQAPLVPLINDEWTTLTSGRVIGFDALHPVWYLDLERYDVAD